MSNDEIPTSFDALAHEHNLNGRTRDLARIFFKAGQAIGRRQERALRRADLEAVAAEISGDGSGVALPPAQPGLRVAAAPGEFR